MAALDWAMWHLTNQPQYAKCHMSIVPCLPRVKLYICHVISPSSLPHQLLTSSVPHVTLIVVTRVTPALVHLYAKSSCHALPHVVTRGCHMSSSGADMCHFQEMPRHLVRTVWTIQSSPFLSV
jgi:hypothetical protein